MICRQDCKIVICLFNNNNNWRAGPPGHEWSPNYPSQLQIDEDKMWPGCERSSLNPFSCALLILAFTWHSSVSPLVFWAAADQSYLSYRLILTAIRHAETQPFIKNQWNLTNFNHYLSSRLRQLTGRCLTASSRSHQELFYHPVLKHVLIYRSWPLHLISYPPRLHY